MKEQLNYLRCNYRIDGNLRLFYGNDMGEPKVIHPCERIMDPNIIVGMIDNNSLPANRLLLQPKDRTIIRVNIPVENTPLILPYPGKSASLYFEDAPTKPTVQNIVRMHLRSTPDRRDHLHLSQVGFIEEAGWQVWWSPLQEKNNLMHVRIVANSTIEQGLDPTIEQTTNLANAFIKAC